MTSKVINVTHDPFLVLFPPCSLEAHRTQYPSNRFFVRSQLAHRSSLVLSTSYSVGNWDAFNVDCDNEAMERGGHQSSSRNCKLRREI